MTNLCCLINKHRQCTECGQSWCASHWTWEKSHDNRNTGGLRCPKTRKQVYIELISTVNQLCYLSSDPEVVKKRTVIGTRYYPK